MLQYLLFWVAIFYFHVYYIYIFLYFLDSVLWKEIKMFDFLTEPPGTFRSRNITCKKLVKEMLLIATKRISKILLHVQPTENRFFIIYISLL